MTTLRPPDLRTLVGIPLSEEQLEAATAPLEPAVIVAGAGSGKTTVMAARVVWLIATGAVEPDAVLGLTFTNKAAAALLAKVRDSLVVARRSGLWDAGEPPIVAGVVGVAGGVRGVADAAVGVEDGVGDGVGGADAVDGDPTICTYHAFAARLLAEHGLRIGVEPGAALLTEPARYQLAYRVVCRSRLPLAELEADPGQAVRWVLALDDALAEHAVEPARLESHDDALVDWLDAMVPLQAVGTQMRQAAVRRRLLAALVSDFRDAKARRDVVDFADQVRCAARLAAAAPAVGEALREQYSVVLLDEYQDTSVAQRRLLQSLFGDGHPVTAVGDPCQAIYGWRGASVHNIDAFVDHFPRRGSAHHADVSPDIVRRPARRYSLTENRRSGAQILAAANDVSAPLRAEHTGVGALVPAGAKGPGRIEAGLFRTQREEIDWVADRIAAMRSGGEVAAWNDVAVLARVGADLVEVADALTVRGVPVEVVGAQGLLARPEVIELVSVLRVLHDPGANVAMLRLLTGPRWRIGPRDLAALGRRAATLAGASGPRRRAVVDATTLAAGLDDAVSGVDPVEIVALADAVDDPGGPRESDLSPPARTRLAALAGEIRDLRRWVGEPLVDLIHRVLSATGLDIELACDPGALAAQRREAVDAFLDLAADFRDLDGGATLGSFLAWLDDAERFDASLEAGGASGRDAVVLMTAHKSKGLEFPVVVLPFLTAGVFPSDRGPGRWPTSAEAVPLAIRDEPVPPGLAGFPAPDGPRASDHRAFVAECRRLELLEETRLGYVAITRAERLLVATGAWWGPHQTRPRGPSPFLTVLADHCRDGAGEVACWAEEPAADTVNPVLADAAASVPGWPPTGDPTVAAHRAEAAALVRDAIAGAPRPPARGDVDLTAAERAVVAQWDADLTALLEESAAAAANAVERSVAVPGSLSASALMALTADPGGFARSLVRPMPRAPSVSARRGTTFHAWLEARFGQQPLWQPDDLPGAGDAGLLAEPDLVACQEAFLAGEWADRVPHAVEEPFSLLLGGHVIHGRIDAVFRAEGPDGADRWEVVDWKTGVHADADPVQLAVYRLAWAERLGIPIELVSAAFVYVRLGRTQRFDDLPGRVELERLLSGPAGGGPPRAPDGH